MNILIKIPNYVRLLAVSSLLLLSLTHCSYNNKTGIEPDVEDTRSSDEQHTPKPLIAGKPYRIRGRWYHPEQPDIGAVQTGIASYYGKRFAGRKTASGEPFNPAALTAAHKTWPLNSRVRVTRLSTRRSIEVVVNDRGPFVKGRIIDLSTAAARALGIKGLGKVKVEYLGAG
ncbi:MAG: septal ring lytic transglycosylase RlpA family protein [Methylococcales bacterium]|nr:septal ring lytic transglycosylase RlpA family protein [Methylococcales bacterium]